MGVLGGKRAYLGGPMQYSNWDHDWRSEVRDSIIIEFKIDLFDPSQDAKQMWVPKLQAAIESKNYQEMEFIAKQFVRKDLCIVDRTDFLIACLPYKVPTVGTVEEIITSNKSKKPTLLVCPEGKEKVPAWFYGTVGEKYMFGSWEALYDYLREVDNGKHQDDFRWAYVYGLI